MQRVIQNQTKFLPSVGRSQLDFSAKIPGYAVLVEKVGLFLEKVGLFWKKPYFFQIVKF